MFRISIAYLSLPGVCSDLDSLAKPLLVGGQRHGVKGLVRACEQHLAATLTPATAPHILLLAHKYSANSLCSATMNYAVNQVYHMILSDILGGIFFLLTRIAYVILPLGLAHS